MQQISSLDDPRVAAYRNSRERAIRGENLFIAEGPLVVRRLIESDYSAESIFTIATLYCTTFPCHNCAKHIVAAGISRVVYIEPYEKSKASEFHQDSIVFGAGGPNNGKMRFEPVIGIGPRRFFDLFSMNLSSGYPSIKSEDTNACIAYAAELARERILPLPLKERRASC